MAVRLSDDMRSVAADPVSTDLNSGTLNVYTGSQPASANDAATGTLLAAITLPADAFTEDGAGVITKTGTWSDTSANASGEAGWARFIGSTANRKIDLSVTVTSGGGDIEFDDVDFVEGGVVTVSSFSFTLPAS